jgi:hypothetical protein
MESIIVTSWDICDVVNKMDGFISMGYHYVYASGKFIGGKIFWRIEFRKGEN